MTSLKWKILALPLLLAACGQYGPPEQSYSFDSFGYFPPEVLFAGAHHMGDAGAAWDGLIGVVKMLQDEKEQARFEKELGEFREEAGFGIREDLLPLLEGEVAMSVSIDSLDALIGVGAAPSPAGAEQTLGGILFRVGINDFGRLDAILDQVLVKAGVAKTAVGEIEEEPVWHALIGDKHKKIGIYWVRHEQALLAGFSADALTEAVNRFRAGPSLDGSSDFQRVRSHLPSNLVGMGYVNLPAVAERVRNTGILQIATSGNEKGRRMLEFFTAPEMVPFGMGWATSVEDGGVKRTSYGPNTLIGQLPLGSSGVGLPFLTSIGISRAFKAMPHHVERNTMGDMRTTATAMESYRIDEAAYPVQAELGPVDGVAGLLEPTYIKRLPRQDQWGHQILYWSDGEDYVLVSKGMDGEAQMDLPGYRQVKAAPAANETEDIVFRDGAFVRWPEP